MQTNFRQHFNLLAKQGGSMSPVWQTINCLTSDRAPESYHSLGFLRITV